MARQRLSPVLAMALEWITTYLVVHKNEILLTKANLEAGMIKSQHEAVEEASTLMVAESSTPAVGLRQNATIVAQDLQHMRKYTKVLYECVAVCRPSKVAIAAD